MKFSFQRKLCLKDAILMHDELLQKGCPYSLSPEGLIFIKKEAKCYNCTCFIDF